MQWLQHVLGLSKIEEKLAAVERIQNEYRGNYEKLAHSLAERADSLERLVGELHAEIFSLRTSLAGQLEELRDE